MANEIGGVRPLLGDDVGAYKVTPLNEFIAFLESHVNKAIYVWGAQGQTASVAFIERHESGNDEARALRLYRKRLAAGVDPEAIKAFDCSGLGMYWLYNLKKIYGYDMSANSMYGKCTPIKKAELKRGDWVFRGGSGRKYHIGYYVGDGIVIESKGRDDGVVKRHINTSGSTYWNAFGRPKVFETEIIVTPKTEPLKLERVLMYGMAGADVKWVQERLKEIGYFKGNPMGNFKALTRQAVLAFQKATKLKVDGEVGKNTITALGGVWVGK